MLIKLPLQQIKPASAHLIELNLPFIACQNLIYLPGCEHLPHPLAPLNPEVLNAHPHYPLVSRIQYQPFAQTPTMIAGPCSVESFEQMQTIAITLKKLGITIMRGGAFKPRTSPYAFQGHGLEGVKLMREVTRQHGLKMMTEIMDARHLDAFMDYQVDFLQIGSRNMQNFELLKAVGQARVPVMLKRGLSATIKEWLMAAEYIASGGNSNIILCERGIRTFETAYRNTLDINAVIIAKQETHLPVIVDPSHAAGKREYVIPLARAALAAGADGVMVEAHPDPEQSWSDKDQALSLEELGEFADISAVF